MGNHVTDKVLGIAGYGASAVALAQQYESISFTDVHRDVIESERKTAMEAITDLVAEEGQVIMSLRHGPVPQGRRMFDVSAEETIKLGAEFGLCVHHSSQREDMLGRADVSWSFVAFRRA